MGILKIAVLPGDGIGQEVMKSAIKVLDAVAKKYNLNIQFTTALVGGAAYEDSKNHLPDSTLEICKNSDAILFGSVGGPNSERHLDKWIGCEKNCLLGLRKAFNLYCNIRPAKIFPGLEEASPLKQRIIDKGFDMVIFRELTGGIYFADPKGREGSGSHEKAFDTMVYHRWEIERIAHAAFNAALERRKKVTSVDKQNVLTTMVLWREVVEEVAKHYSEVEYDHLFVDNAAAQLLVNPGQFDVVLCGNMFGDIFSDEAAMATGSLGLLASASLAEGNFGMYEPGGGSAPDIAGKGIANPIAQILSAAMMLEYSFGLTDAANDIVKAIELALYSGYRTRDICTSTAGEMLVNTKEITNQIIVNIEKL